MITPTPLHPIQILLADDDLDDSFLFERELEKCPFNTQLTTVGDGEELMNYLAKNLKNLPDILFLDNNMPRKNGTECLQEIKKHPRLKVIPVIMYSTYVHEDIADLFFNSGAHFYIRKTDHKELRKLLHHVLSLLSEKPFSRPLRGNFILRAAT